MRVWDGGLTAKIAKSKMNINNTVVILKEYLDILWSVPANHAKGKFGHAGADS